MLQFADGSGGDVGMVIGDVQAVMAIAGEISTAAEGQHPISTKESNESNVDSQP